MSKHDEPYKLLFRPASRGGGPREPTVFFCCVVALPFTQGHVGTQHIAPGTVFTPPPSTRPPHLSLFLFPPSQGGVAGQPELPLRGLHENGRHQLSGVQAVRRGDEGQLRVPSLSGNQSSVINRWSFIINRWSSIINRCSPHHASSSINPNPSILNNSIINP